jgi:hypothetical protein
MSATHDCPRLAGLPRLPVDPCRASLRPGRPPRLPPCSSGRFRLPGFALLVALGLSSSLVALGPLRAQQPAPAEVNQDFRGGRSPLPPLGLVGPDADAAVRPEAEGLRITLAAGRPNPDVVGPALEVPVTGDFEITTGYEILQAEPPGTEQGVGVELFIQTPPPAREGLGLYRVLRTKEGEVYMTSRNTTVDGKRQYRQKYFPTAARSGRFRMTRTGAQVTCWVADGADGPFQELGRYDFSPDDLNRVRMGAYTGGARSAVDVRVVDLRIRSAGPIPDQGAEPPPPAAPPQKTGAKRWLLWAGLVGLGLTLVVAVWLFFRQNRRPAEARTTRPEEGRPVKPAPAASPGSLACPGCGKRLRARPELAGKKVKCPHCGVAVPVPGPVG